MPQLFEQLVREPNFVYDRPFTLQPTGRTTTAGVSAPGPFHLPAAQPAESGDEGDEDDQISAAEVDARFAAKTRGAGFRDSQAALTWSDYADFDAFISSRSV